MKNERIVMEWMEFAEMDYKTALHLYDTMYPSCEEGAC